MSTPHPETGRFAETFTQMGEALDAWLAKERVDRFASVVSGTRMAVSGTDLIGMGAAPSEAFSAILARALDDRLDGRAVG